MMAPIELRKKAIGANDIQTRADHAVHPAKAAEVRRSLEEGLASARFFGVFGVAENGFLAL